MEQVNDQEPESKLLEPNKCDQINKAKDDMVDPKILSSLNKSDYVGNDVRNISADSPKFRALEFDWMSYLEAANKKKEVDKAIITQPIIEAVPNDLFLHVEASLDGGVREGMIVEMPYDDYHGSDQEESRRQFWLARVDAVYGPLLKLSYVGSKVETKPEIWHDLTQKRLFPLGYCQMNRCQLKAPEEIQVGRPDWEKLALQYQEDVTYDTLDMHHIEARNEGEGVTPIDRFRTGTVVEVQDEGKADVFWPAIVSNNHGGRLGLTYLVDDGWKADEGFIPSSHVDLTPDITLFYLSPRIFPKGYAKGNKEKFTYTPPLHILARNPHMDVKACLEWEDLAEGPPPDIFAKISPKLEKVPTSIKEAFRMGGEVEIIHPRTQKSIERGLVLNSKVENYFLVQLIDDPDGCQPVVRHCLSSDIFPSGWSESLSAKVQPFIKDSKYKQIPKKFFPKFPTQANQFACHQKLEVALDNG